MNSGCDVIDGGDKTSALIGEVSRVLWVHFGGTTETFWMSQCRHLEGRN